MLMLNWAAEHPTLAEAAGLEQLAAQWHPTLNGRLTPADVTTASARKVWWTDVGSCGHQHTWLAVISSRVRGTACPICSGKRPCICNNLAVKHPELVEQQWDTEANGEVLPEALLPQSNRKVAWRCKLHHPPCLWLATPNNRTRAKYPSGCPQCPSGRRGRRSAKAG